MLRFPFAKINLGLQVLRRRADGYHDIRSILFPIPLYDALEAVLAPELPAGEVQFESTGLPIPGDSAGNLCLKAVELLRAKRDLPGLRMHLHKAIPMGAGLGGGSSDGANTLFLLNQLLELDLTAQELQTMAAQLGSDCPFFLKQQPQLAEGRGERLSPVEVDLRGYWLVLVNPGIHVPTAEVYQGMQLTNGHRNLGEALQRDISAWQKNVVNDMEEYVFAKYPAIATIKDQLRKQGAVYAAMSGSGSSVFGLFSQRSGELAWPAGYRSWAFQL